MVSEGFQVCQEQSVIFLVGVRRFSHVSLPVEGSWLMAGQREHLGLAIRVQEWVNYGHQVLFVRGG